MLESVKNIITELPDIPFGEYYQNYICEVQDQNVYIEISKINPEEIVPISKMLSLLWAGI